MKFGLYREIPNKIARKMRPDPISGFFAKISAATKIKKKKHNNKKNFVRKIELLFNIFIITLATRTRFDSSVS